MRHRRLPPAVVLLALAALAGCGGGGSSDDGLVVRDGAVTRPGTELVLEVPEGAFGASSAYLASVYDRTLAQPACQDPADQRVPFLVAETCLEFHDRYLEPDRLPPDVADIETPDRYLAALTPPDRFAVYYTPEAFAGTVEPGITGERAYIGIVLTIAEGDTVPSVERVLPYTRGWWDGLRAGDRILGVRDPETGVETPFDGMTLDQARALLPQTEEAETILVLDRDGSTVEVATAAETHIGRILEGDVAYLGVRKFTTDTARQVWEDYGDLVKAAGPVSGIVLDLRQDGGGSLQGAVQLADLLAGPDLDGVEMFHTEDAYGLETRYRFGDGFANDLTGVSLVVLLDGGSASASEIVAGVLRYHGVATLVGERTFGKGVAQDVAVLADGSALFVPSLRILLPDGSSWHGQGLTPDREVAEPEGVTPDNDPQLEAAIQVLRSGGSAGVARSATSPAEPPERTARRAAGLF
ncbi:S41 family peptidase [Deferrisoma camini]|uniref:S41 family peptidase n=1 Tax=Deferrisoma camini TaxID=1035120 RepID=UPI00046CF4B6|nr:S41 family peptidase [Deferrisoma camini]